MSSPITGNSFQIASAGQSFCERMTNLLSLASKMKLWFDWAFDTTGKATNPFKAQFLPPSGTIREYYTTATPEAAKLIVEGWDRDSGDTGDPFWRIADGTGGLTPDLRGRVLIGAGQGTSLTNRVAGLSYGSETITLTSQNVPPHKHQLKTPNNQGIPCWDSYTQEAGGDANPSVSFASAQGKLDADPAGNSLGHNGAKIMTEDPEYTASQVPVDVSPISFAVYIAIRTTRNE